MAPPAPIHPASPDESPVNLERLRQRLPRWLQRFLPSGGGQHHDHHGKALFGLTIFLISESLIFVSFFVTYIVLRRATANWVPAGVSGPTLSTATGVQTGVLLASSFVIYLAERSLQQGKLVQFRGWWLLTSAMGIFFLWGEAQEWANNDFGLTTGLMGATYYLLTGFHGLHVWVGIGWQMVMLGRSFRPKNYQAGHFGVSAGSLFWHFVDGIWLVLFSLLYLWRV
ncbi:MAG: cytochrome c oxidase subunit 3 [Almyronema sp.]